MVTLKTAIDLCGGPQRAASILGMSARNVYKMLAKGHLPRTEFTGETDYAHRLAGASDGVFTADELLAGAKPTAA